MRLPGIFRKGGFMTARGKSPKDKRIAPKRPFDSRFVYHFSREFFPDHAQRARLRANERAADMNAELVSLVEKPLAEAPNLVRYVATFKER